MTGRWKSIATGESCRGHLGRPIAALGALCLALASISGARAETFPQNAVKAAFLYRFAAYVEWPAEAAHREFFTIGVSGSDGVAAELERLLPELTVEGRRARVRKVSGVDELESLDILYIGAATGSAGRVLLEAATNRPILIVTERPGSLADGSVINFVESGRNVRFEISLTAAERSGLKLSSALLSVASRVEGGPRAGAACEDGPLMRRWQERCPSRQVLAGDWRPPSSLRRSARLPG